MMGLEDGEKVDETRECGESDMAVVFSTWSGDSKSFERGGEHGIRKRWGGPSGGSVKMEEHGCEIASSCLTVLEATQSRKLPRPH